jgi:nucleoside-diphosphate-sugar epimerase
VKQVDVRDVARAHILALTAAAAANKRIILVGGLLTPQLVVNAIRANFPELRDRVVEGVPAKILPEGVEPTGWDTRRSFEVFGEGWGYRELEETVVDTVRDLLAREAGWKE